jgi:RNA polymerase sigma-70 factor, ECF subfamily
VVDPLDRDLSEVYSEHAAALMRYARMIAHDPEEARDAVQECFLSFCMERRQGRIIESSRAWLFQVLRNHLLTKWNSAANVREIASDTIDAMPGNQMDPEALVSRQQRSNDIRRRLSPRELECLQLRAEGLSYAEVGKRLNIQSGTVGALLSRAAAKLRWTPEGNGTVGLEAAEAIYSRLMEVRSQESRRPPSKRGSPRQLRKTTAGSGAIA